MMIVQDQTSHITNDKLKKKNKMIKLHASCVSHDMRAPLGAITHVVDAVLNIPGVSQRITTLLKPVRCTSKVLNC
jgi:light-regulated signal transduction histidine kinase (bacteriophytochrome)